jgi:hypothetical protein
VIVGTLELISSTVARLLTCKQITMSLAKILHKLVYDSYRLWQAHNRNQENFFMLLSPP